MKFAAFISIIVSVAVLFAACAGAVGPPGEDGADGMDGADGATGPQGPQGLPGEPGFTPLQLKGDAPFIVINDVDDDDDDEVADDAGEPSMIDLTDHFRGGTAPFDYGTPMRVATSDQDNIDAALVDGGPMLKLSVPADNSGDEVSSFTVKITDADDSTVQVMISARRNNAPGEESGDQTATVGTAVPAKAPAMAADCPAFNECTTQVTFVDADAMEVLSFTAKSGDSSKVEIVSVKTVNTADGAPLVASLVLKGVGSSWNSALDTPANEPVTVTITAMDRGGMTVEDTVAVTVDGAPQMKGAAMPDRSVKQSADAQTLIADLSEYFEDPESETLTYMLKSSNTQAATVTDQPVTNLQVTTNGVGSTEITVTATEPSGDPQQMFSQTFTLMVTD